MNVTRFISVILPLKLEWEPCYSLPEGMDDIAEGDRVRVRFAGKDYIGVVSAIDVIPESRIEKILCISDVEHDMEPISKEEICLWRQIADYYLCTVGEVYKAAYPYGKTNMEEAKARAEARKQEKQERSANILKSRIENIRGRLLRKEEAYEKAKKDSTRETYRKQIEDLIRLLSEKEKQLEELGKTHDTDKVKADFSCPDLTVPQRIAYDLIQSSFASHKPVLLHGVTGSGKTEIYMKAAAEALSRGRNVLYLIPEIALSRQLEDRLIAYFGDYLLTYHSALTAAAKRDMAHAVRSGRYIVLGTRSSIFLPHHDLGLIIIDEEHDSSYKQDSPAPRYNGRDSAIMLSKIHGSDTILGSATPSLESLYNCNTGKYNLVQLTERYHGATDSAIEIIDTKAERRKRGMIGNFSIKLIKHIESALASGSQTLILRSRRAYSPVLQCQECGKLLKCPHCNVSVSWHKENGTNKITCHHCGWKSSYTGACPECGSSLAQFGAGTQKIEEEARILFPSARIARLDSDSAQNRSFENETIKEFSKGNIDILIGTQIISKGFDFSNLGLVVIISADSMLALQDFRADEKAVQLMEQLRGRSGRRGSQGLFVIQTSQPQHPVYKLLLNGNAEELNMDLLEERKVFGFPPYSRIINLTIKDRHEDRAMKMSSRLAELLSDELQGITGPYPPIPDRIMDMHIRCIRITLAKDKSLQERKSRINSIIESFEKKEKYTGHISIDVDPS